jgi:hypothetical protein
VVTVTLDGLWLNQAAACPLVESLFARSAKLNKIET